MANVAPIGIFDSGIGGLTVFAAIKKRLPHEPLVYLGDTARVPYGTKSRETVVRYSIENATFLASHGVKAVVVACNTASAMALDELRARVDVPVIGVVEPGAQAAIARSTSRRIGVIGTRATIDSDAYGHALRALDEDVHVVGAACSLFVPLVEEGWLDGEISEAVAIRYLTSLKEASVDVLILGCTHYPLLKDVIAKVMGDDVALVDSALAAADALAIRLHERGLAADGSSVPSDRIFVTDVPGRFEAVARRFLGGALPPVEHVRL